MDLKDEHLVSDVLCMCKMVKGNSQIINYLPDLDIIKRNFWLNCK